VTQATKASRVVATLAGAALGYLAGSVSFSRLVAARVAPDEDVSTTEVVMDAEGDTFVVDRVTPAGVGAHLGNRWGGVATLLEITKAAVPVFLVRQLAPDVPEAAKATAAAAVVGHVFPVFHGFRGGFGQSPIIGGTLVLDPRGLAVSTVAGSVAGVATADALVMIDGWPLALIPWAAWRRRDLLPYALAVNAVYWWATWPEVRAHVEHRRRTRKDWLGRFDEIHVRFGGA
jgi:glycerol-3-phosphate acyltransferase PlsY